MCHFMSAVVKDDVTRCLRTINGYGFEGPVTGPVTGPVNGVSLSSGDGAPTADPTHIGALYVDVGAGALYVATAADATGWKQVTLAV